MEELFSNTEAIAFGRRKIQEIPEMSVEEAKTLKKEMENWCTYKRYSILMPSVRFFQDNVIPKLTKKIKEEK